MIKNIILLSIAILISTAPLIIYRGSSSDNKAAVANVETTSEVVSTEVVSTSDNKIAAASEEAKIELFSGADDQAEQMIGKIAPKYEPWFKPLWEPPSGEIECLLFALQAALGAGVFFYYVGYVRGRAIKDQLPITNY